jgi:hypothetical protein
MSQIPPTSRVVAVAFAGPSFLPSNSVGAMSTIIPRLYDTYGSALDAAAALKKYGFRDDEISLISNAPNREDGAVWDPAAEAEKAGIPKSDAPAFAAAVDQGKSLLVVRAVWGAAVKAIATVNKFSPLQAGVGKAEYSTAIVDVKSSPHVFSSNFGLPLLWNDPAPFSKFLKWPVLWNNAAPLSSYFNWPTQWSGFVFGPPKLINDGALFSKELKIPVLWKGRITN